MCQTELTSVSVEAPGGAVGFPVDGSHQSSPSYFVQVHGFLPCLNVFCQFLVVNFLVGVEIVLSSFDILLMLSDPRIQYDIMVRWSVSSILALVAPLKSLLIKLDGLSPSALTRLANWGASHVWYLISCWMSSPPQITKNTTKRKNKYYILI